MIQSLGLESLNSGVQAQCLLKLQDLTSHIAQKFPTLLVKATLSSPEHPVKLTPKSSTISRKASGLILGSMRGRGQISLRSGLIPACSCF